MRLRATSTKSAALVSKILGRTIFGPAERAFHGGDIEFLALPNGSGGTKWLVKIRNLPLLGPYEKFVEAWTVWREMDRTDRQMLERRP